jgi:hypothetical protein
MPQDKNNSVTEIASINDPQNSSRRRAVKTIVGGVGALTAYHVLPVNWTKPVVEQVFLPAHAAVSGITLSNPCNVELVSGDQASSIDVIRVSGFVTPPVGGLDVAIAALPNGGTGGQVDVFTTTNADGTYSAEVTMVGGPGIIGVGVGTAIAGAGNISGCAIGIPPEQQPTTPTTTTAPTTTPAPTTTATPVATVSINQYQCASGGVLIRADYSYSLAANYTITFTNLTAPFSDFFLESVSTPGTISQTFGIDGNDGDRIQISITNDQNSQEDKFNFTVACGP